MSISSRTPRDGQTRAEVAVQYGQARRLDVTDAAQRAEAERGPKRQSHDDDQGAAPQQRLQDDAAQARQDLGVETHEQDVARRKPSGQSPGAGLEAVLVQLTGNAVERRARGQMTDVAGDPGALRVEQAVEVDVADVLRLGVADSLRQPPDRNRLQAWAWPMTIRSIWRVR
ncbi:MAG: hypothetical protein WDM92_00115 [Caulobacteraceae bacterium]